MKKLVLVLSMLMAFAFSSIGFAADGGDLNKEQKVAEKLMTSLAGDTATTYAALAPSFSEALTKSLSEAKYGKIQKQSADQLGSLKENKFVSFERFDQADRVTYVASFSKENVVIAQFVFSKDGKLENFALSPYKAPQKAAENK